MLELIYSSRKSAGLTTSWYTGHWWIPWWEAMLIKTGHYEFFRVFPDGTKVVFTNYGSAQPSSFAFMNGPNIYTIVTNPTGYTGNYAMAPDRFTLLADAVYGELLTTMRLDNCVANRKSWPYLDFERGQFVVARDVGGAYGLYVYTLPGKELVRFIPYTHGNDLDDGVKLEWVSPTKLAVIGISPDYTSQSGRGKVGIIDWVSGTVDLYSLIDPYWYAAYDHINKVFWSVSPDNKTRIYTLNPVPATLSNPEWVVGGNIYTLQLRKVRVKLTGSVNEPCVNWWVHWALSAGEGSLFKEVSKTDEEGYAYNYYSAPDVPVSEAINAWVVVN